MLLTRTYRENDDDHYFLVAFILMLPFNSSLNLPIRHQKVKQGRNNLATLPRLPEWWKNLPIAVRIPKVDVSQYVMLNFDV